MAIKTNLSVSGRVEEDDVDLAFLGYGVVLSTTWTEYAFKRITVANGVSDLAVSLDGCSSGDVLFIKTNKTISIKLDGDDFVIAVSSIFVSSGGHTSLTVSNASGEAATVEILVLD